MSGPASPLNPSPLVSSSHQIVQSSCKASLTANSNSTTSTPSTAEEMSDTGTIEAEWSEELLNRYDSDLSKLDDKEEALLHRLAAIQKLQLIWSTAGRESQMKRSDERIQLRTNKILLEDTKLTKKRQKLSGVVAAIQNVVGMLDDRDANTDSQKMS